MGVSMSQITSGLPGDVINVAFAANDYKRARDSGKSAPVSAAKAFTSFAWGEFYYGGLSALNGAIANSASKFATETLGSATLGATLGKVIPGVTFAAQLAVPIVAGTVKAISQANTPIMKQAYLQRGKFGSGHFNMTEAGYTMRQRSLNAIRNNGLNLNSVLGNEARQYFR